MFADELGMHHEQTVDTYTDKADKWFDIRRAAWQMGACDMWLVSRSLVDLDDGWKTIKLVMEAS